jgi:MtaA/CmuA family methyltransferase
MSENIIEKISKTTFKGDYKFIGKLVRKARRQGHSNEDIIKSLSIGLIDVSKKYKKEGMFLDDIIKAAGTFEAGFQSLGIQEVSREPERKVVLGVMGGPWTIGTNIIAANLKAHGFEVIDAGSDISPQKLAETVKKSNAKIAATAIYLMQSIKEIKNLEDELWKLGIRHKMRTILSGPAASNHLAEKYNYDSFVVDVNQLILKVKEFSEDLKSEMTPLQRVMTSVDHKEPDRVPFVPFAQTFTAKFAGIPFSEYVSKAENFFEGQLKAYKFFGWDALCFSSDVGMYAEALGAKIEFPYDDVPRISKPVLTHTSMYNDFEKLKIPDLNKAGRLTESIKAIEMAKKELKDEVPLIGWLEGPFQGVTLLAGGDPMQFFYVLEHPEEFKEILDWYVDFINEVAGKMYEVGADIVGVGETAAYFMSPSFFEEFCLKPEKQACGIIKDLGMIPLIHCCGYVPQCIHFALDTNPGGAIQFDYQVDLQWAKNVIGNKLTIMGNLNYNKLLSANSQEVYKDCIEHIKIAASDGGYWLAFGCEIPRDLPIENLRSILRAIKTVGKYPINLN